MLKISIRLCLLILLCGCSATGWAAQCLSIWPAAATASSSVAPTLPAFSGTTALTLNRTLGAGDFHYSNTALASGTLTTSATTTRLYFNGGLTLSNTVSLNPTGNPQNLIIIVNGSVSISGQAAVRGLIYATGSISISNTASIQGAVTAAGSISTTGGTTLTYSASGVANASYGSLCTPPQPPVLKIVSPVCGASNKVIVTFASSTGYTKLGDSAETIGNYSISGPSYSGTVTSAVLSDEGYEVQLTLSAAMVNGRTYTVSAANVQDLNGTTMTAGNDAFYYASTQNGVVGSYWGNETLSGGTSYQQVDSNIDFDWGLFNWPAGAWYTGYSIRWEGYLEPATTGNYVLQTVSEDGSRVWLNDLSGSTIINRWNAIAGTANSSTLALVAGQRYPLKVEFFKESEAFSTKEMRLRWQPPGSTSFSAVPNANLYTCVSSFVSNTGLVAHYKLEGPSWNGTTNEVKDASYNNLHGTTINNPTAQPAAVCNGAVMNGTNFIRVNDNPLLDLTNALSITAWIKLDQLGSELKSIFSKDTNYEFHIDQNRYVYWWWNTNSGATRSFTSSPNRITLGQWHHIGVVYSSTRQSIYLDGVERAFQTYSNEILRTNSNPLEIGADQGLTNRNWVGSIDEVKLYDRAISGAEVLADMNATNPCAALLDHFEITAPATCSVCSSVPVTIRAVMSNGNTYTGYSGTINITNSANHGNWTKNTANGVLNPVTDSNDDGAVQYSFTAADNGQIILNLTNTHADQLTVTATENGTSTTGTSGVISFSENAFDISVTDSLGSDFVAGRDHALQVEMLRLDPVTGSCGRFTEYDGSFPLKAWLSQTGAIPASVAPSMSTTTTPVQLTNTQPAANNVTLAFGQGLATFSWITSDVGQHALNLRDDSSGKVVDVNGNPLPVTGSSANFTVRPFGLYLRALDKRAIPGGANPAATSASGAAFVKAGENFDVFATGVNWNSADDANNDGVPDSGADLSNNTSTPAFGSEGETVSLSSTLLLPNGTGAVHPGLSGTPVISSFTSGAGSSVVQYDEVGIIEIGAALSDSNYLGSNNVVGRIANVGRFYPDHFAVSDNAPLLRDASGSWSCDFTYQGQTFGFATEPQLTITALNTAGSPTLNYSEAFWSLPLPQHSVTLDAASVPAASACLNAGAVRPECFTENSGSVSRVLNGTTTYDGIGTYVTGSGTAHALVINKLNGQPDAGDVPYAPLIDFTVAASALTVTETNGDSICYQSGGSCAAYVINDINGTEIRYGRGWIDGVTGPVMTPLIMPLRLQYWNAAGQFVANTADNDSGGCSGTLITTGDIQFSNFTANLQSGETSVTGLGSQPGYYLMSLAAPGYSAGNQPNAGTVDVTWLLDADTSDNNPGEECTGFWLCYDYDGDGLNENPSAKAIFSALPDSRPVLFLKETFR